MMRWIGSAAVLACVLAMGCMLGSYQRTVAAAPAESADSTDSADSQTGTREQLKEINVRLKRLDALLRSGDVRVTVVVNPDRP